MEGADRARPEALTRRRFLTSVGASGAAVAVGTGGFIAGRMSRPSEVQQVAGERESVAFYGTHQAGIATPAQDRVAFAAFDVTTADAGQLKALLGTWSAAASRMTLGLPIGSAGAAAQAPPIDTGEALDLSPARLTITVGFGSSLFDERFGLAKKRPAALVDLPVFTGDTLDPGKSNGDLCVQACSDDPQVAFHVLRNFARLARGVAVMRWSQLGFGRTSSTSVRQQTPRNLMGFKDGTNNVKAENSSELADFVWVGDETDQAWMRGGSYCVTRRIRMTIETWDNDFLGDQEAVIGRTKSSGAPLTGKEEFDEPDLAAKNMRGELVIPADSHIRLAAPATNDGQKLLRRGYSYTDGIDQRSGLLDAGLFFIAYQKDPRRQFVPIQRRLAAGDALNEYIRHTGSGVFAIPPGLGAPGDWYGKRLFG